MKIAIKCDVQFVSRSLFGVVDRLGWIVVSLAVMTFIPAPFDLPSFGSGSRVERCRSILMAASNSINVLSTWNNKDYALQLAILICSGACLGNEWAASRHEDEQDRSLTDLRPHVALHEDPHRTDGEQRTL